MTRKPIDPLACSTEIAQALKKGVFLTTKNGDKVNAMVIGPSTASSGTPSQSAARRAAGIWTRSPKPV